VVGTAILTQARWAAIPLQWRSLFEWNRHELRHLDYLFVAACIIAVSPGSGAVLSMSHGLSYGVRRASATILGLQSGLLLVFFIAGAGVGSLLLASKWRSMSSRPWARCT
jgi:hypothetical protein